MDLRRPRRITLLVLFAAIVCPACLILDPTNFPDPENQPPVILSTEPASGDVQFVDRNSTEPVVLRLQVFDGNEEDVLDARAFVDPVDSQFARQGQAEVEAERPGDPRERSVTVTLERGIFARGCHVVEVDVADSTWAGSREVTAGGGMATETWFVLAHDGDGYEDISLASCPGADSGGAP